MVETGWREGFGCCSGEGSGCAGARGCGGREGVGQRREELRGRAYTRADTGVENWAVSDRCFDLF